MRIRSWSTIPLLLILGLAVGIWVWADVPPESQATTQVQVINSQGQKVQGAVIYWTSTPRLSGTDHPHSGSPPSLTLSNPSVDYSYTDVNGIASMVWNTPEYSGHYPWKATCPNCQNWSYSSTVYVDWGTGFGTQLAQGGTGYGTQYDGGHPYLDFAVSSFMNTKAANIGSIYSATTLSRDGVAKSLIYTRTGTPGRGTLDNNSGYYFELRSNPDPHSDRREVIDIVWPGGNDSLYLEQVLQNIRTSSGTLGWQYYGVGNNLQGQNILHADGT